MKESDFESYVGDDATLSPYADYEGYLTREELRDIKKYIGSDCSIIDTDGPNNEYAVIEFSDGASFTIPFEFLDI